MSVDFVAVPVRVDVAAAAAVVKTVAAVVVRE